MSNNKNVIKSNYITSFEIIHKLVITNRNRSISKYISTVPTVTSTHTYRHVYVCSQNRPNHSQNLINNKKKYEKYNIYKTSSERRDVTFRRTC